MPPQSSPPPLTPGSPDPALTLAHLQLQRETILRALASKSLLAFIQCINSVYQVSQFHTDLASQLQSVLPNPSNPSPSRRLIIQAPCRHGKSELSSRALPAWYLGNRPDHEVVICTHTQELADDFGRWCRRAFQSPRFASIFPEFALDPSSRAANRMDTRLGGGIRTVGVDGPLTGRGAHLLVIDDPLKNRQEADSPTIRDNLFNFYSSVLRTRLAPGGSIVIIMSRWHEDDLSGRLQLLSQSSNGEKFTVLDYPVLSGPGLTTPLDPNRWPYEALMALKTSLLPRDWAALYMQRPTVAGTGLLNPAHLILHPAQFYASSPSTVYCAWDVAVSDASHHRADASAGVAVCRDAFNNFHLIDLVHGRFPTHKLIDEIIHLARKHNAAKTFIEGGGIYKAVIPFLHDRMRALNSFIPVQSVSHGGNNKITRSTTLQGLLSSGSLHTSEALPNLPQLRHEFDGFPNGTHDDIVDALAYATNEIQKMKTATSPTNNRASPFTPAAPTQSEYLEMVKRALLSPVSTSSSPTPSTDSDLSWD